MAEIFNFRSAFNGFRREDVVHYIEYLNTKHTAEINQLNTELAQVREQHTASDEVAQLQAQLAAAQEINDRLQARIAELEEQLTAPVVQNAVVPAAPQCSVTQELEAYRRAERTEREAKERSELIYRKANGALADATVRVDEAFVQIGDLTEKVNAQLQQLQQAVTDSRQALADAATSLSAIAPGK